MMTSFDYIIISHIWFVGSIVIERERLGTSIVLWLVGLGYGLVGVWKAA